jgi:glycosyltransferase involved in cell wall biosynthesis
MDEKNRIRVVHIITDLNTGGAEMMLYGLLSKMDRSKFKASVISLTEIGSVGKKIQDLSISVRALSLLGNSLGPREWLRLVHWLREDEPDIVQTWLYHADLFGGLAARWAGPSALVWGIHSGTLDKASIKRRTLLIRRICARLSKWLPTKIVCVAQESRRLHAGIGYAPEKMRVIPNGFDMEQFKPNSSARRHVRAELRIPEDTPVIGLIGRYAAQKDHRSFIEAAALLSDAYPEVHFLLAGENVTWDNTDLLRWITAAGIRERTHLLGLRVDVPRLLAALDIVTSSSAFGEAFPMVIGEAMASGVPCVVTDVGDSSLLVGDTGKVVPIKAPAALAQAWRDILDMALDQQKQLGCAARKRINDHFSLHNIAKEYELLYLDLVSGCLRKRLV